MNRKILFLLATLLSVFFLSCSDDDESNWDIVSAEVRKTFEEKYPQASHVEWENKSDYKVAEFIYNSLETYAWFDSNGTWYMSETDIPFNSLPQAIKDAFNASEYSTWKVDDVDMLERKDTEVVYIIEVESQNKEIDLYYSAEGILIKAIEDNDNSGYENHIPQSVPSEISAFIHEKYPLARIIEIEFEKSQVEVNIIHDNKGKEVIFDSNYQWLYTSWDVRVNTLPQAVANIVNNPQYTGYYIDDAEFIESVQANYYLLELEKGNSEIKVKVHENGNILN